MNLSGRTVITLPLCAFHWARPCRGTAPSSLRERSTWCRRKSAEPSRNSSGTLPVAFARVPTTFWTTENCSEWSDPQRLSHRKPRLTSCPASPSSLSWRWCHRASWCLRSWTGTRVSPWASLNVRLLFGSHHESTILWERRLDSREPVEVVEKTQKFLKLFATRFSMVRIRIPD